MAKPERTRTNTQREERLLAEFLAAFFPRDEVRSRIRVGFSPLIQGPVPLDPAERQLLKRWSRWADALVIRPTDLILIEAEVLPSPGIVSTLELYARLFRGDEDFAQFAHLPLRKMLVWGFDDPVLARLAQGQGIEVRIFSPAWLADDLRKKYRGEPGKTRPVKTPELD